MIEPRFSFVATSRNDDHGGDVLRRTQSFLQRLAEQCERHQVSSELVLVDWNPPRARAPLADVLAWPAGSPWFSARVITVPEALHRQLKYSSRLAMFQMIAKNVGIRRARGEYTIATNIDIIFSDELFRWLKSEVMQDGVLYRSDRWDIPNEIQLEEKLDLLLQRARREAIRRNVKDGTYVRRDGEFVTLSGNRFDELVYYPVQKLAVQLKQALDADGHLSEHDAKRIADDLLVELPKLRREFLVPTLHTNACGDFTMLAQRDWSMLRGYPEWNMFSWHIDSVLIFQAHYAGLRIEEIGRACVHYHIEHDYGSGWTPEGADSLWARLVERGIPFISYAQFKDIVAELQEGGERGAFKTYNDIDWGFVGHDLEDRYLVEPGSLRRAPRSINAAPLVEQLSLAIAPVGQANLLHRVQVLAGARLLQRRVGDDGALEIALETPAETWSYAATVQRSHLPPSGEHWIKALVAIDSGNIEIGVHDRSESMFLAQANGAGSGERVQTLLLHIPEIAEAGNVILRNITAGNQPARIRLHRIEVLCERSTTSPAPDEPALKDEKYERILAQNLVGGSFPISAIKPLGRGAIVRVLTETETNDRDQALIILPAAAAAAVDLAAESDAVRRIALHLHVIEGEATIGFQLPEGGFTAEHRQGPSEPMTRVDLEATGRGAERLVIRNAAQSGRTTLLVHRAECLS